MYEYTCIIYNYTDYLNKSARRYGPHQPSVYLKNSMLRKLNSVLKISMSLHHVDIFINHQHLSYLLSSDISVLIWLSMRN